MPAYNAARFIGDAIRSVQAQTFGDWELVIIDDVSSDDTAAIVTAAAERDGRIAFHRLTERSGGAVARNTAMERATGRYIAFLDADDMWLPEKLEAQLAFMRETRAAFSFSAYQAVDADGNRTGRVISVPESVDYAQLLRGSPIGCLTAMYDREVCGLVLMPLIRKRQDYALWLKIVRQVGKAYGLQQCLGLYRVHAGSLSSNKLSAAHYTWKVYREIERLPLPRALFCFAWYALEGIRKTITYRLRASRQ